MSELVVYEWQVCTESITLLSDSTAITDLLENLQDMKNRFKILNIWIFL